MLTLEGLHRGPRLKVKQAIFTILHSVCTLDSGAKLIVLPPAVCQLHTHIGVVENKILDTFPKFI